MAALHKIHIDFYQTEEEMASKQISVGVGIPMIIAGIILGFILAPTQADLKDTIEFVGSLIGILGVLIFIAGFLSRKVTPLTS